ncbi:MAG TPA: hypothetical protein VKN82_10685 [Desulfohalobiaceae bacterium]|nr:hypothetical protein [Desulfohalobiaceae bacterium]
MTFKQSYIPWIKPKDWYEANKTLSKLIQDNLNQLNKAIALAKKIEQQFNSIFPLLDHLCSLTCTKCPDPCCLRATIWFDFKDLLFLHLTSQALPIRQTISTNNNKCPYSSRQGCQLPRLSRPWICTWYICPDQKRLLGQDPGFTKTRIYDSLESIKSLRKRLEDLFIDSLKPRSKY